MSTILARTLSGCAVLVVLLLISAMQYSTAFACTLVCNGELDPFTQFDEGITTCYGSVEWQGCDGGGDTGGGDGGGGGETTVAPSVTLSATPATIQTGYSSRLTWSSANATSCSINQGVGSATPVASGERTVSPTSDITYTITCTDALGRSATDTAFIDVTPAPQPFSASCDVIPSSAQVYEDVQWMATVLTGGSQNLAWRSGASFTTKICSGGQNYTNLNSTCPEDITDGDTCSVEGERCRQSAGCDGATYTDPSGEPNAHTQYGSVTPYTCTASGSSATYAYSWSGTNGLSGNTQSVVKAYSTSGTKTGTVSVTSSGSTGTAQATCSMNVAAPSSISVDLTAVPATIAAGAASVLNWAATNADVCTSDEFDTVGATSGTLSVSPGQTTLYSILCTKSGTGSSGTYRYSFSDISDLSCPITDPNKAYRGLQACPVNPEGKACTSSCRVNRVVEYPGVCAINTDVYTCEFSGGSPTQTAEDSATVTVTGSLLPNLSAGGVTPTSAAFGSAVTFSATVSNSGTSGSGATFATLWQRATNSSGTGAVDQGTTAMSVLGSGATAEATKSITLPARSSPWYLRACADKSSQADAGTIAESSEIDNCGAWTQITECSGPSCPGDTGGLTCSVDDSTPNIGQPVTFTATPRGSVNGPYSWVSSGGTGPNSSSATITRTYSASGPYTMVVNSDGHGDTCTVNVGGPVCSPTADLTLSASPNRVRADSQTFAVSWTIANTSAASCRITGTDGYNSGPIVPTACSIPTTSVTRGPISTQTTYTLTCGASAVTTTVNVIPGIREF